MNPKDVVTYLLKSMPVPEGCELVGDASIPCVFDGGVAVRRSMSINVSARCDIANLNEYINACNVKSIRLSSEIVNEYFAIISTVFPEDVIAINRLCLTNEGSDDVYVYYSKFGSLTIRAKYNQMLKRELLWEVSFVVLLYNCEGSDFWGVGTDLGIAAVGE